MKFTAEKSFIPMFVPTTECSEQLYEDSTDRMESIRRTSNIIQALENLEIQCTDEPEYDYLVRHTQAALREARRNLNRLIHVS